MADGREVTAVRDKHYDLVSVLYHTLQEADVVEQYIADAREAGDAELAGFFDKVQADGRDRAQEAKRLLRDRIEAR